MFLKIVSPERVVFTGHVDKATIPTEIGEITILPGHQPLSTVVVPGLAHLHATELPEGHGFLLNNGAVVLSVSKGLLYVDGEEIVITTSAATASPEETEEVLMEMSLKMEEDLAKIKEEGNVDNLEEAMINMEKINADLRLVKMKNIG